MCSVTLNYIKLFLRWRCDTWLDLCIASLVKYLATYDKSTTCTLFGCGIVTTDVTFYL